MHFCIAIAGKEIPYLRVSFALKHSHHGYCYRFYAIGLKYHEVKWLYCYNTCSRPPTLCLLKQPPQPQQVSEPAISKYCSQTTVVWQFFFSFIYIPSRLRCIKVMLRRIIWSKLRKWIFFTPIKSLDVELGTIYYSQNVSTR